MPHIVPMGCIGLWKHSGVLSEFGKIREIGNVSCYEYRRIAGCKENHFYSLPFGQAEATVALTSPDVISTSPNAFWWAELISQFFCYSNTSTNISCPSGKLKTEFTYPIAKSTSPELSDTTFFARWVGYLYGFSVVARMDLILF